MKKLSIFLISMICLVGLSYGQSKMSSELRQAIHSNQNGQKIEVIITMSEQFNACLYEKATINMSRSESQAFLVDEMKQLSERSQKNLIAILKASGAEDIESFWIFNGISCKVNANALYELNNYRGISDLELNKEFKGSEITMREVEQGEPSITLWNVSKINADKVWTFNGIDGYTGAGVLIGIIDSGCKTSHNDIKNNLWNDGSNHYGYNAVTPSRPYAVIDEYGQGTLVAGIVAGDGSCGQQTGVAKGATAIILKASNSNGYTEYTYIHRAIQNAIDNHVQVIALTIGENSLNNKAGFRVDMENLLSLNIPVAAAAGDNAYTSNIPNNIMAPSNCPSPWHNPDETLDGGRSALICVGATDRDDFKATFSSMGPVTWENTGTYNDYPYIAGSNTQTGLIKPDLVAPGVEVTSLLFNKDNNSYTSCQGTPIAAAHVAGVMALLLQADPTLTPAQIDAILEQTAVPCSGLVNKNNFYGAGRVDAYEAMCMLKNGIDAPTNLQGTAFQNIVTITWNGPSNAVSYDVYCDEERIAQNVNTNSYVYESSTDGLHTFFVKANKADGKQSARSKSIGVSISPAGPIAENLNGIVYEEYDTVHLSWEAPSSNLSKLEYANASSLTKQKGNDGNKGSSDTYWAQRYPASMLTTYAGAQINNVSIFFKNVGTNFHLYLYTGNPNGCNELLYQQTFTPTAGWYTIELPTPIDIDYTKDLWVVARAPYTVSYPAAYCQNNNPNGLSSFISKEGKAWVNQGNNRSWMFSMQLSTGEYTYNISCDGNPIASNVSETHYDHLHVAPGTHEYTITTNYNGLLSLPCAPCMVAVQTHYTVTLDAGNGTCEIPSIQETSTNSGVELPSASPCTECEADGYGFAGWTTSPVTETEEMPELILAGTTYHPTQNTTLYAAYSCTTGGIGHWNLAHTIHAGDSVCIVAPNIGYEMNGMDEGNSFGTGLAFTDEIFASYPFTVMDADNGKFTFRNAAGDYLGNSGSHFLCLKNAIDNSCKWSVEAINDIFIVRNSFVEPIELKAKKINDNVEFTCYELNSLGTSDIAFYRYDRQATITYAHEPACGTYVKTPSIYPLPDGINYHDFTVYAECITEDAQIRYTTDGTEPTQNSALYNDEEGILVTELANIITIKAFKQGMTPSASVSYTYQFPPIFGYISDFKRAANSNIICKIGSSMQVSYRQNDTIYVCDETGGLMIRDDYHIVSSNLTTNDVILGGIQGRYTVVNNQPMFIPTYRIEDGFEGAPVTPWVVTVSDLNSHYFDYDAMLVKVEEVLFNRSVELDSAVAQVDSTLTLHDTIWKYDYDTTWRTFYHFDTITFQQDGLSYLTKNQFETLDHEIDNNYYYDVVGIMGTDYNDQMIYPRNNEDIRQYHNIHILEDIENGSISTEKGYASFLFPVVVNDMPENGYHLTSLYYYTNNPTDITQIDITTKTFEMPDTDITIGATFEEDVYYTVTFNPGTGVCDTESLTEQGYQSGIVLPNAAPSNYCLAAGYIFQGWAEYEVTETMVRPELFAAGSTYYPAEDITLYAVFSVLGGSWADITDAKDVIEGNYIIAAKSNNMFFYFQQKGEETTDPTAKYTTLVNGIPKDATDLWTIASIGNDQYSISYTDGTNTYYIISNSDQNMSIRVVTDEPTTGWVFTQDKNKGLMARFIMPSKADRYLGLKYVSKYASKWYDYDIFLYNSEMHLFLSPSNVFVTNPQCEPEVEDPVFVDVPEGVILDANYMVTITCPTPDASIYYTLDGSEPDNTSNLYTGSFAISETTNVKAIAYNVEGISSHIVEHLFSFARRFDNIAAFKAGYSTNSNEIARITGDVTFVFRSGRYMYVCDETAGLLIFDKPTSIITNTYENGDIITGGITGTYSKTYGQARMIPTVNPAVGVPGTPVEPISITNYDILTHYNDYDARLVTIEDGYFTENFNFGLNRQYEFIQDDNAITMYDQLNTATLTGEANVRYDVTGFVAKISSSESGLYPLSDADFVRYYDITCAEALEGGSISTYVDHARANDEVTIIVAPAAGYQTSGLTVTDAEGGNIEVSGNTFVMPAMNVSITATFEQIEYTITTIVTPEEAGTVTGAGIYHYNDEVTLIAQVNEGYKFRRWKNGDVNLWYGDTYKFNVTSDMTITAEFEIDDTKYNVVLTADPAEGGILTGAGEYTYNHEVTVTATANPGYIFTSWTNTVTGNLLSTEPVFTFNVKPYERELTAHFEQTQAIETQASLLLTGWNWYSSYIEYDENSLSTIEEALAENGSIIKSNMGFNSNSEGHWEGSLSEIENEQMYMIKMNASDSLILEGNLIDPAEHPIEMHTNWNWIGYLLNTAMSLEDALVNLTPSNNDLIKSKEGFSTYSNGNWEGSLDVLVPGKGYLYKSCSTSLNVFYYPSANGKSSVTPEKNETYWNTDLYRFANNLTMIISLDASQFNLSEGLEIGAFVKGECRGAARLTYSERYNRYFAFLTVNGDENESICFGLYDGNAEQFRGYAEESILFHHDDVYGTMDEPYILHFACNGIGENDALMEVYPNPTRNKVTVRCAGMSQVRLVALTGQILMQQNVGSDEVQLNLTDYAAGLYLMQVVTSEGNTFFKKIEIQK